MKADFLYLHATLVAVVCLGLTGCGTTDTGEIVPTVPVSGTVTYNGKPLQYYQITLFPSDSQRPAAGVSDTDGKFVLGTNEPGDGAIEGTHTVAITYVGPPNSDPGAGMMEFPAPPPPSVKIPENYRDPKRSGVTVEVPKGGLSDWQLDLK
jgi:hypothetical protein